MQCGHASIRLDDVVASGGKLLVRLDPRYGAISRKIGSWTLVAMLRLAAELRQARSDRQCLFVIDEPRLLGHEGRHLAELFGTARDEGLGLVVADQGIAGLTAVHPDLPDAVLRSTGWQLVMRQGSPADAQKMAALFGMTWRRDVSESSDGRSSSRWQEGPRVYPTWLLGLPTGSGWLRVAPTTPTARERVERIVVALPHLPKVPPRLALPVPAGPTGPSTDGYQTVTAAPVAPAPVDPERAAILRLVAAADANGYRGWRGSFDEDGYPRAWWDGHYRRAGRLVYSWQVGEIPKGWTIDHTCRRRWCMETAHMEPLPRAEHARREAERRRLAIAAEPSAVAAPEPSASSFAIALFAGIDRPAVQQKEVSLDELRQLLSTFEAVADKRRGRCWSPTAYLRGHTSRGNAGVEAVSALVLARGHSAGQADTCGELGRRLAPRSSGAVPRGGPCLQGPELAGVDGLSPRRRPR